MIPQRNKGVRAIVALLVVSISVLYFPASLMTRSTSAQNANASAVPMVGRLEVHRGKHIKVNGSDAETGDTILDGQTLETSECTSATVHLLPQTPSAGAMELGQIELATNTKAVINYSAGKVNVRLLKGCARVGMARDIVASIGLPDGTLTQVTQADALGRKHAEICFPSGEKEDFRPTCAAVPPVGFGGVGGTAVFTALAAALTFAVGTLPCTRGQDTSPDTPPGECI